MMRRMRLLVLLTVLCGVVLGCSKPAPRNQVNVLMWSEYIDRAMLADFQKRTGLEVRLDEYEATEDMVAKLQQAGGTKQYDVVVASDHIIPVLAKLNLIQPLDRERIPNSKNVMERFARPSYDPEGKYSLPYQWGTMGLMYRKDKIANMQPTWAMIFDPARQPGRFTLIDSMRDMMAAALKYQGKSVNTADPGELRAAGELLAATKKSPQLLGFEPGVGGKNKVVSGDAVLAIVYSGDAIRATEEDPNVDFILPREGTIIWVDAMTIPAHAPNLDGAYQFIDWILDAQTGAALSNFNRYATPNAESLPLINKEDRENKTIYPDEELLGTMEYLEDMGPHTRLYDEVWTAVKSR